MGQARDMTIVWFRRDLRVADHAALVKAAALGPVLPVFILDEGAGKPLGRAARVSLYAALETLQADLARLGGPLWLGKGDPVRLLPALAQQQGAGRVFTTRLYEPAIAKQEKDLEEALREKGVTFSSFDGSYAFAPGAIMTGGGAPYKVFTPFYKAALAAPLPPPLPVCKKIQTVSVRSPQTLQSLALRPHMPDWAQGFEQTGDAAQMLDDFLTGPLSSYAKDRDFPARAGTSLLSAALHWGQITPAMIFEALKKEQARNPGSAAGATAFWREVLWRDFAAQLLYHFPETVSRPFQAGFASFPWGRAGEGFERWQKGLTGFPIIDAGMRQLWQTGWMHGRVRMIVASFLCKDLLIPWQQGEAWFAETLIDADRANNVFGWQWTAGCGADAAPYFRVFNPVRQALAFDPDGAYVRRYVPELAGLAGATIHAPHQIDSVRLDRAGVQMGRNYPAPMLDHAKARQRALAAYALVTGRKKGVFSLSEGDG